MAVIRGKKRFTRVWRVTLVLTLLAVGCAVALMARIYLAGLRDDHSPADVIIVLGAAQYDGTPAPVYLGRLEHALALYHAGDARYLLFTGGSQPGDRFTEALAGRRYAQRHGVPPGVIFTENAGHTTLESLIAARQIMHEHGLRRAILVSDPFHAFRLRRMARDLGLQATVSPTAHSRIRSGSKQAYFIAREAAVYLLYRIFKV
ncbi:MAG: YdcF family protein [Armatimonadota bacterium]